MNADDVSALLAKDDWLLDVTVEDPRENAFAETLAHLSNGFQGLRVGSSLDDPHGDPQFLVTELYDVGIGVNREIASLPNPLGLRLRHGYEVLRPDRRPRRVLDLRHGLVYIDRRLTARDGTEFRSSTVTAVHATKPWLGLTTGTIEVPDGLPTLAVETYWDNTRGNQYLGGGIPELVMSHVAVDDAHRHAATLELDCHLVGTGNRFRLRSMTTCAGERDRLSLVEPQRWGDTIVVVPGDARTIRFDVRWCVDTDLTPAEWDEEADVRELWDDHRAEWRRRWDAHGTHIGGDPRAQEAIRFAVFNLLQHELPVRDRKITPARGLSSTYHSGSTFFDTELHKDAFWGWTYPEAARSHLAFRHAGLAEARAFADRTGFRGARFPEATNDLGRENGPYRQLTYPEDESVVEWSGREVLHISADVSYAVRRYHQLTGDTAFVADQGVEIVLESARYAASVFRWSEHHRGYVTRSVMGPDEYHYHVDNNYFTNSMLRWNLQYALALLAGDDGIDPADVGRVRDRIGLTDGEIDNWRRIAGAVFLPADLPEGVPAQHEGYVDLADCPLRGRTPGPSARLSPDEADLARIQRSIPTKLVKQADIVLLMHLFPDVFDEPTAVRSFAYYEQRTAHESSLSAAPHGVVAARLAQLDLAYGFFLRAARYNLDFEPRQDYRNGLHLSAFAGAWQILVEGFLGLRVSECSTMELNPRLPDNWTEVVVPLVFRRRRLVVHVDRTMVVVSCDDGEEIPLRVNGHAGTVSHHCPYETSVTRTRAGNRSTERDE